MSILQEQIIRKICTDQGDYEINNSYNGKELLSIVKESVGKYVMIFIDKDDQQEEIEVSGVVVVYTKATE